MPKIMGKKAKAKYPSRKEMIEKIADEDCEAMIGDSTALYYMLVEGCQGLKTLSTSELQEMYYDYFIEE